MTAQLSIGALRLSACLVLAATSLTLASPPSFAPIPGLPGDNPAGSRAYGISGDGSTVVGEVRTVGQWEGMIWTRLGGTRALGPGVLNAASYDGSIAVGSGVWRASTGWQALAGPPGAHSGVQCNGISSDGSTIVGSAYDGSSINHAVRWTVTSGAEFLPWPDGQVGTASYAIRPSDDGSRVVGSWTHGEVRPFDWSPSGGSVFINGGMTWVRDMTSDGQYVVGEGGDAGYRWSRTAGMFAIPRLPGYQGGVATGISADGRVVVGGTGTTRTAYIWDPVNGTRSLGGLLQQYGVDLGGFTLLEASDISADGRTIIGLGRNSHGVDQAWIATIPTPSCAGVLLIGAGLASLRRRRRDACGPR